MSSKEKLNEQEHMSIKWYMKFNEKTKEIQLQYNYKWPSTIGFETDSIFNTHTSTVFPCIHTDCSYVMFII